MGRTSDARKRLVDAAHDLIWSYSYGAITVEAICDRARVQKGSFYHFFDSKSDLAVAAIQAWWDVYRPVVDELFRPEVPPLERIGKFLEFVDHYQTEAYEKTGQIPGCPLFSLGSEICTQDERLRVLIGDLLGKVSSHFEVTIRDAQASGEIEGTNCAVKSRLLWAFFEGTLTRARIENNPELIHTLPVDALELMRARPYALESMTA